MRQLVIRHLFCIAGLFLGVELAFAQLPPPGGPGFPPPILPPSGGLFPPQLPPPFPPPPPPPQVGQHPVFGLMCAGPLGPGPCADVHRFLLVQHAANYIQLPFLGFQPGGIPICNGPLGPGPCRDIQVFLAVRTIAQQQIQVPSWQGTGTCIGPMGPVPCPAVQDYLMQSQSGIAPGSGHLNLRRPQVLAQAGPNGQTMCGGPAGPVPCVLLAQIGLDMLGGNLPPIAPIGLPTGAADVQKVAQACANQAGLDMAAFTACTGHKVVLPQRQQEVLDCAASSRDTPSFAACAAGKFGIGLSDDQRRVAACAIKAKGVESAFRACGGAAFISKVLSNDEKAILDCAAKNTDAVQFGECAATRFMGRAEKAVVDCAMSASDPAAFALCAAPNVGVKMSNDQRVLAKCAMQSSGDSTAFANCAGAGFLAGNLGPNERKVLGCAAGANGDTSRFAACSANALFGDKLSKEQQIAVQCAAQSQGDPTGFATCAGANLFGMQLNAEQQIAIQCVVGTGGNPPAAAGCMASRLTARELSKCLSDGIGGRDGCFGDNNDLVGKNGFVGRTLGQIAGGHNSIINNPGQIWGGDNSFLRNPGQIWGGPNSFVRNPAQIWGGPNSVFRNPSQLLPQPRPMQIGTVGGKRICLPWC